MAIALKKAAAYKIQTATSTRVADMIYASYSIQFDFQLVFFAYSFLHFVTNKQRLAHKDH